MIVGIGSDLCNIERIQNSLDRWGDKFLNRVFTETERKKAASRPHTIAGTLYSVPDHLWRGRLRRLDLLEGYDAANEPSSHYLRRRWTVTPSAPAGPPLRAWLYLAGHRVRGLTPDRLITSGDWMRRPRAGTRASTPADS